MSEKRSHKKKPKEEDDDNDNNVDDKTNRRRRRRRRRARGEGETHPEDEKVMKAIESKLEKLDIVDSDDDDELAAEVDEEQAAELEKQGFWFRKKKAVAGKVATSRLGNALFKKYMDEETVELFDVNKRITTAHKDAAFSKKLHKDLMRIATKTILLYDNETFTDEDFQEFRVPFRKICNLIKNNFARGVWDEALVKRISQLVVSIKDGLVKLLSKHVKKDTLAKLESCADYLGSTEYLNFAHKQEAEYKTMVEVFSYYLEEYD
eukprot:CAMPEP_0168592588 /NCGR_PEP_ID=MMETSP0420-20121227/7822_1 /TAXON_ID=498008 /ORGANISM="Pessonella sp." /LENGTH=263 /DNA_ID=CAMNT_0008628605 /DNA_START=113 /DNA_END=901 /DNA_ORIENTATION=+